MKIDKVFVYGSLKKDLGLHAHLADRRALGAGMVKGFLFSLGAFPALVLCERGQAVVGEVYHVDQEVLTRLDRVEGHPDFYTRCLVRLQGHGPCHVYVQPADRIPARLDKIVLSGVWDGPNTASEPWDAFLKRFPQYGVPTKPHTVYDPQAGGYVVNQYYMPVGGQPRPPVVAAVKPKVEELPAIPDEAYEALAGMKVEWA